MIAPPATCNGCAQAQRRFRSAVPRLWCQRFHQPALARCIDYRTKRSAIATALDYLKRGSIK
jgi:hypothetical protein